MKNYQYKGYIPYGAAEMFCLDVYVEENFEGNVVEEIIANGLGEFKAIDEEKAVLVMKQYDLDFVKR